MIADVVGMVWWSVGAARSKVWRVFDIDGETGEGVGVYLQAQFCGKAEEG